MAAIRAFDEPIVLLLGGRDKKLPWEDLARLVCQRVDHVVLFGESAAKIEHALRQEQSDCPNLPSGTRLLEHQTLCPHEAGCAEGRGTGRPREMWCCSPREARASTNSRILKSEEINSNHACKHCRSNGPHRRARGRPQTARHLDLPLLVTVLVLVVFGLIMLYSASWDYSLAEYGDAVYMFTRQLMWLGLGWRSQPPSPSLTTIVGAS